MSNVKEMKVEMDFADRLAEKIYGEPRLDQMDCAKMIREALASRPVREEVGEREETPLIHDSPLHEEFLATDTFNDGRGRFSPSYVDWLEGMVESLRGEPFREEVGEGHPEYRCGLCGNANNPTWYAPNELWNEVMGSPNGIICPKCFQDKAQAKGITTIGKVIRLDDDHPDTAERLREGEEVENLIVDIEEARDVLRALFINEGKPHTIELVGEMNREVGAILDRWTKRAAAKAIRERLHKKAVSHLPPSKTEEKT